MIDVAQHLEEIVSELRRVGVRASTDPSKVQIPGAWVSATQIDHNRLCGGGEMTVSVYLVAPDRPAPVAHGILSGLLAKALGVIDPTEPTATGEAVVLSQSSQPLPTYRMTTTIET